jgi:hypothetical protein
LTTTSADSRRRAARDVAAFIALHAPTSRFPVPNISSKNQHFQLAKSCILRLTFSALYSVLYFHHLLLVFRGKL